MPIDVTNMLAPIKSTPGAVTNTLSEAWAAVIGDRVTAWRLKNAAALQSAVNIEASKLGLKLDRSKIPERYALAWFEEATKQDEPEIQELFARLLARAAAGDEDAGDRRHLEMLTHFTPMDAKVMEWIFRESDYPPRHPSMNEYKAWNAMRDELGPSSSLSIEHLITLGVFEREYSIVRDGYVSDWQTVGSGTRLSALIDELGDNLSLTCELSATQRGISLYKACTLLPSAQS